MWTKWIIVVTTEGRAAWDFWLTVRINDSHILDGSNYNN